MVNRRSAPQRRTHALRGSGMEDGQNLPAHPNIPRIPRHSRRLFWHVLVHSCIDTYPVRPGLARWSTTSGTAPSTTAPSAPPPGGTAATPCGRRAGWPAAACRTGSRRCQSGGNWSINTGNGFYGALQLTQSSWPAAGGSGSPQHASRSEQIPVAQGLQKMQDWVPGRPAAEGSGCATRAGK
jgi:hypothetical protein